MNTTTRFFSSARDDKETGPCISCLDKNFFCWVGFAAKSFLFYITRYSTRKDDVENYKIYFRSKAAKYDTRRALGVFSPKDGMVCSLVGPFLDV